MSEEEEILSSEEPIHHWFELTYAQYLTIPRSVLQSMPIEWQRRFVACLNELDDTIDWRPGTGRYWVELRDSKGRFVEDIFKDYQRGRRRIEHRNNGQSPSAEDALYTDMSQLVAWGKK